jgi:hypothetical protein
MGATVTFHICLAQHLQEAWPHYGQSRGDQKMTGHIALRSTAGAQVGRESRVLDTLPATPEDEEWRSEGRLLGLPGI